MTEKRDELIPLEPLDLQKCETVSDIVKGMGKCSFGARMLGEVADTLEGMIKEGGITLLYDGKINTPLYSLLERMTKEKKWFSEMILPVEYVQRTKKGGNIVVAGPYSERHADVIYDRPDRAVYINKEGLAKPGQVKDGHFPDVIFSDPKYIMPILFHTLEERREGKKCYVRELIGDFYRYGGLATEVHQGAGTLQAMVENEDCMVFLTLSGAMTIAKMGLVICEMIDRGMVQAITTTGALMAHGLVEGVGRLHYKYAPTLSDEELAEKKHYRVTDTLELGDNLTYIGEQVINKALDTLAGQTVSPTILNREVGKYLKEHFPEGRAILKSALEKKVPVFVPAFYDSELGNDVYAYNRRRREEGREKIFLNQETDHDLIIDIFSLAKRVGIFSIGGGVPRNFTQNVPPLIDYLLDRNITKDIVQAKFSYGIRICPEPMYYGNLGGCTYSEGKSWRKMNPQGRFSEIHADATLVWPFLVKYLMKEK